MPEHDHHHDELASIAGRHVAEAVDIAVGQAVHDLRTPIAGLVAAGRLLAGRALPEDTIADLVEVIDRSEAAADAIIADLVDRARRAATEQLPERARVRVRPTLEHAAAVVEAAHAVPTTIDADPALEAWTDATSLYRIVQNLLDNAARHSGCDRVHLRAASVGARVVIEIVDHGPGLPAAAVALLSSNPARDATDLRGLGLGLLASRQLVRDLGGSLVVDQEETGLRLVISLPQREVADGEPALSSGAGRAASG